MLGVLLGFVLAACHGHARHPAGNPPAYDHSCKTDSECVLVNSCCPSPCGTELVNVRDLQRANADLQCDPDEKCPVAGGCIENQDLCVEGTCKIVFAGDPAFRKRNPAP